MARYFVEMVIEFSGYLEADSEAEAEALAWTSWGDTMDSQITYDNVYSIRLTEDEEDEEEEDED